MKYGEHSQNDERISTGFVELTVNDVVRKRLVKKQQMHWTPLGAHLVLHVRTQVLTTDWEATFRGWCWYPTIRPILPTAAPRTCTA